MKLESGLMRWVAPTLALALAGCPTAKEEGSETNNNEVANQALESAESAQNESALLMAALSGANSDMSAEELAGNSAQVAGVQYQPSTCVDAASEGASVTYTLNDCTGPYGLVHVTGTLVISYEVSIARGVTVTLSSTGLMINGGSLDLNVSAVYTTSGDNQSLAVDADAAGTGARGVQFTHMGDYTATWNNSTECAGLNGGWTTTVANTNWSLTIDGLEKCAEKCPKAGGSISFAGGLFSLGMEIRFDGSATAQWTTNRGKTGTAALLCTPN